MERLGRLWKGQGDCGKVCETVGRLGRQFNGQGDCGRSVTLSESGCIVMEFAAMLSGRL